MLATVNSSSLKGLDELKSFFRNKSQLSEAHFAELINATLNRRDDHFYGVWKAGRTYRPGDVVYYQSKLWEMTATTEICSREREAPGTSGSWNSGLKALEDQVKTLETDLKQVRADLQAVQQDLAEYKQQTAKLLSLLTLGFGFLFFWLLMGTVFHLI